MTWVMCNLTSFCLETVLLSVQDRCMVCASVPQAHKLFWTHPMEPLGDEAQVESCYGPFGDSVSISAR